MLMIAAERSHSHFTVPVLRSRTNLPPYQPPLEISSPSRTIPSGTGSSSAALITSRLKETEESIHVTVPGGELVIRIEGDTVYMEGPAEKVAEIEI